MWDIARCNESWLKRVREKRVKRTARVRTAIPNGISETIVAAPAVTIYIYIYIYECVLYIHVIYYI